MESPPPPDSSSRPETTAGPSLRDKVMQGARYMIGRQMTGVVISAVGMILLTRMIGPANYGLYAATLGVLAYITQVSTWGIDTFLIRERNRLDQRDFDQAFTLLGLIVLGATALAMGFAPLLSAWMSLEGFLPVALMMFIGLPLVLLGKVPQAVLESSLDFKKVALIALVSQLIYQPVALGLAWRGAGAYAPVAGWWASQVTSFTLYMVYSGYRPALCWEKQRIKAMLGYGLGYASSMWVWQLRTLVNPLIVGSLAGAEAVGNIALAMRLVTILRFAQQAVWRLSIAAMAKMQDDFARLLKAVNKAAEMTTLLVGLSMAGFGIFGPYLMGLMLGPKWSAAMAVFPYVAAGAIFNAAFSMQSSALYVLKKNWSVTVFHAVHVALFAGTAWLLLDRAGFSAPLAIGCGELVALVSYAVVSAATTRAIGRPRFLTMLMWAAGFSLLSFWSILGPYALLGAALIVLAPVTLSRLAGFFSQNSRMTYATAAR